MSDWTDRTRERDDVWDDYAKGHGVSMWEQLDWPEAKRLMDAEDDGTLSW